jgi:hypothetical protein
MSSGVGRRLGVLIAVSLVLVAAMAAPPARAAGGIDLVVSGPFTAKWVAAGNKNVLVQSEPADGSNRLVIDVLIDQTNIKHIDCSCTKYDKLQPGSDGIMFPGPRVAATYDVAALPDGTAHTLTVNLTKYPSGSQVSQSYAFTVDRSAPTAFPDGELVWVQNAYLGNTPTYGLTLGGYDEFSGMSAAGWKDLTTGQSETVDICSADPCENDYFRDIRIPLTSEGKHTLVQTVTDLVGNVGQSGTFTVSVDRTGPAPPQDVQAVRDASTGEAFAVWGDGGDAALPDGTPGSGTDHYQYRYSINGGPWTAFVQTDDTLASLGSVAAGTPVAVDVAGIDAVNNTGTTASVQATVADATISAGTEYEFLDPDSASVATAQRQPQTQAVPTSPKKVVTCVIYTATQDDNQPVLADLAGESNIEIVGSIKGRCMARDPSDPESVAAFNASRLTISACLEVERSGGAWEQIKCDHSYSKRAPTATDPLNYALAQLCEPGSPRYRIKATSTVTGSGTPDRAAAYTKPRSLSCNEAGAFRRIATRNGDAGGILGRALNSSRIDPRPNGDPELGDRQGWEAHHIVPGGEGKGTEGSPTTDSSRAQRYAYDCGVMPNSGTNGVWLRGPKLEFGTSSYETLDAAGKNRALHRSGSGVHTAANKAGYYRYVADQLSVYVNDDTDACLSTGGAAGALGQIRSLLIDGTIPG